MPWRRRRFRGTAAKARDGSVIVGTLAVRSVRGFEAARHLFRFYLPYALHFRRLVVETADMGAIGNEGKHVCIFRDKPHGRQPCAPYLGFVLVGQSHAA